MTTIANFSGLSSGIDTASIITQLTTVAQKPIKLLQTKDNGYNAKLATWQQLNASLLSLQTATNSLNEPATFSAATASSSDSSVATITTLPGAAIGDHSLTVTQVAQAQRVVSSKVASGSTALGQSGSFTLNGKTVSVSASDSLTDISVKINAAGAGAAASVVNVGPNDFRLTLSSNKTGAANTLAASDSGGTVLADLGLITAGTAGIRQTVTGDNNGAAYTGAASLTLTSATQAVSGLLGIASGQAPSGTFHLSNGGTGSGNEADIAIDLNTASLSDIANAVNAAGVTGISAEVVTLPDANGNLGRIHQLQIVSSNGTTPTFTDGGNVLGTLGVLQNSYAHTLAGARDAQFNIDGLDLTRSSNSVADVIPGATLKLLSGTAASPGTTAIGVTRNTDAIVQSVQSFASAYNAIQDFVTTQNKFTPPTDSAAGTAGDSAPLFGDTTLNQIADQLARTLSAVSGKTTLQDIGLTLDEKGHLNVNTDTLTGVLQTSPDTVSDLFSLSGKSDSSTLQFVHGGPKTAATSGTGYAVTITQPATQASGTYATALPPGYQTTSPQTLTFGGGLYPSGVKLTIPVGSSPQDIVGQINNTSSLSSQVYASLDSAGHLVVASQKYGAGTAFTVSLNSSGASGPGTVIIDAAEGKDVAGTINGEAATGNGRTLTGSAGNAHTEGLQILVTATAPTGSGTPGHVTVTHGVADSLGQVLSQILDPINGAVVGAENSLNSQISDTQQQIQKIQDQVSAYQDYLQQLFSQMETRIQTLKAQGDAFTAQVTSLENANKK